MTWQRSEHFHAGEIELIVEEVNARRPTGVVDAAWASATLPHGSGDRVLAVLARSVVNRPFERCVGPSLVDGGLEAEVRKVSSEFSAVFAKVSDEKIEALAVDLAEVNDTDLTNPVDLYRQRLEHLRTVCTTYLDGRARHGLDVVFVRFGSDPEQPTGAEEDIGRDRLRVPEPVSRTPPRALARSGRGLCPTCGVPLQLPDSQGVLDCELCGERLVLECRSDCGSRSKLERRLLRAELADADPPRERTREDEENQRRGLIDYPWDITTEQLIRRILDEPDVLGRVHLAGRFREWGYINATSAHFLPFLLRQMQRDVDPVAYRIGEVVGKLLCRSDRSFHLPVVRACETVIHDAGGKRCLLDQLGLGDATSLKILLDAAQRAVERGDREYACHALGAVNTIFGRRFEQHEVMARIVLYRLFDLTGPALGWALHMLEEGFHYGYGHPTEELLELMDELLQVRPELAPALRRSFDSGPARTTEQFRRRLALIRELVTPEARAAACEQLWYPPTRDAGLHAEAIRIVEGALDHPVTREPAGLALRRLFDERPHLAAMEDLIRRRGDTLPERLRAGYCRRFPDQELLDPQPVTTWQDWHEEPQETDTDRLVAEWKEGFSAAIDRYESDRRAAKPMLEAAEGLDLPIFTRQGPATIPL